MTRYPYPKPEGSIIAATRVVRFRRRRKFPLLTAPPIVTAGRFLRARAAEPAPGAFLTIHDVKDRASREGPRR